jgi:hypothetical protein
LRRVFEGRKETLGDILLTIPEKLQDYRIVAALWDHATSAGHTFSITNWHQSQRILILPPPRIVAGQSDSTDAIACFNRMLFTRLSTSIDALPEAATQAVPPRMWMILDELRFAGNLPGLDKLLTQGASKGARVVVTFQDISGLREAVGKEKAEEITSLCANQAFFRAGNSEMAKWMASQFGTERVRQSQVSVSDTGRSTTYQTVDRPVLLDATFLNLPLPDSRRPYRDLEGYFRTAEHGCWRAQLSAQRLFTQQLIPPKGPSPGESADYRRPANQQILAPWSDEDSAHFGLPVSSPGRQAVKSPPRLSDLGLFRDPEESR